MKPKKTSEQREHSVEEECLQQHFRSFKQQNPPSHDLMASILKQAKSHKIRDVTKGMEAKNASFLSKLLNEWSWLFAPAALTCTLVLVWTFQNEHFRKIEKSHLLIPSHPPIKKKHHTHRRPAKTPQKPGKRKVTKQRIAKGTHIHFSMFYSRKTTKGYRHRYPVKNGSKLKKGDLIQFSYQAPKASHVMIISMAENGELSLIEPFEGKQSILLQSGEDYLPKEGSLALDNNLGKELFVFLSSTKSFTYVKAQKTLGQMFLSSKKSLHNMVPKSHLWHVQYLLIQKVQ